jgi:hypothetical protein
MTTLAAWISYSATGERPDLPKAIYFASDSRITWGSQARRWDAGRKLFSPVEEPHLFGYCGDVVFPSLVLGQVVSAIDSNILFDRGITSDERHEKILESIKSSFHRRHNTPDQDFSILHAFRKRPWPATEFLAWHVQYQAKAKLWTSEKLQIPTETKTLIYLGSGRSSAKMHGRRWETSDVGGTSRSIFSAFCESINAGSDRLTGGPPQIAALYTKMGPRTLGVVKDGDFYLHGLEISRGRMLSNIEWRDELFQRIDQRTLKALRGARRFARPHMK